MEVNTDVYKRQTPCRAGYGSLFWDWNRGCIRMAGRQPRQKVAGNKARRTCHCPPDVDVYKRQVKRFVQANLSDIDAHYPDDFYNPAITRLYRLKEYMEENK